MINVGILDERPIVRAGLELFLAEDRELAFAGHTGDAEDARRLVRDQGIDVLVCALQSSVDVIMATRAESPDLAVLVLSDGPAEELLLKAIRMGAKGHLQTNARRADFLDAIRTVAGGRTYLSASLAEELISGEPAAKAPHEALSEREFQVFMKMAQGKTAGDVSKELSLSIKTVATYRSRVMEKMQLTSNSDLTYYAMKNRLIE
ncbi:LuxR C-terminal-related transcriptional regulator [Variovorax sp. LjRoot178]|uniref:LuxR C-terminal-related transcriptional regulator n=1 Tax=Variovorax sp. LjRoot178 TaxID=3342277 RepID=UPI003ED16045